MGSRDKQGPPRPLQSPFWPQYIQLFLLASYECRTRIEIFSTGNSAEEELDACDRFARELSAFRELFYILKIGIFLPLNFG